MGKLKFGVAGMKKKKTAGLKKPEKSEIRSYPLGVKGNVSRKEIYEGQKDCRNGKPKPSSIQACEMKKEGKPSKERARRP